DRAGPGVGSTAGWPDLGAAAPADDAVAGNLTGVRGVDESGAGAARIRAAAVAAADHRRPCAGDISLEADRAGETRGGLRLFAALAGGRPRCAGAGAGADRYGDRPDDALAPRRRVAVGDGWRGHF